MRTHIRTHRASVWVALFGATLISQLFAESGESLQWKFKVFLDKKDSGILIQLFTDKGKRGKSNPIPTWSRKLKQISAGPSTPQYQINLSFASVRSELKIRGNRKEVQWLCDELVDWTGLPISYRKLPASFEMH